MKYIVVTGGVCSSLGKGVTTSSLGAVLRARGFHVTVLKVDPYINVDAGLMSPFEHGEVFVLEDGGEVDLDLGNYERTLDLTLGRDNNITTGKVYQALIERERRGDYLGKTVQVIPHFTDMVREHIEKVAHRCADNSGSIPDVCLIEVGGTVGDMESMPFLESLRLKRNERYNTNDFCLLHLSYVPTMDGQKTKPTQHSVHQLQGLGLQPDLVCCRSQDPLELHTREKISLLSNIPVDNVISLHNVSSLYDVPNLLDEQKIVEKVARVLKLVMPEKPLDSSQLFMPLQMWAKLSNTLKTPKRKICIAFVGKYLDISKGIGSDTYLSAVKALEHSGLLFESAIEILWISAADLEEGSDSIRKEKAESDLLRAHGIFLPGGFGNRGIEGIILAVKYARTNGIPFFGVCLGMQFGLVEFARSVLHMPDANSEEIDPNAQHLILKYLPDIQRAQLGATMRLGAHEVHLTPNTLAARIYHNVDSITERHRHRYEFNDEYLTAFEKHGMIFSGKGHNNALVETIELAQDIHPFFFAAQFHPEYKTRPFDPSPPFSAFIAAAITFSEKKNAGTGGEDVLDTFLARQSATPLSWRYRTKST